MKPKKEKKFVQITLRLTPEEHARFVKLKWLMQMNQVEVFRELLRRQWARFKHGEA